MFITTHTKRALSVWSITESKFYNKLHSLPLKKRGQNFQKAHCNLFHFRWTVLMPLLNMASWIIGLINHPGSWFRHWATSWKVAGSIPDGFIATFHWHNPAFCIVVLGSTPPLTEMGTRNIFWGLKLAGAYSWQPYDLQVPIVYKFLEPQPPGTLYLYLTRYTFKTT